MWDFLLLPIKHLTTTSVSSGSTISIPNSNSSSRRSSLSSSRPEFRPIHSDIIRRNLVTDFLEATSLPVNVPIHRSREASRPSNSMQEEYDRCDKQIPLSLHTKLFSSSPQPCDMRGERREEAEEECEEEERRKCRNKKKMQMKTEQESDLMFLMEIWTFYIILNC